MRARSARIASVAVALAAIVLVAGGAAALVPIGGAATSGRPGALTEIAAVHLLARPAGGPSHDGNASSDPTWYNVSTELAPPGRYSAAITYDAGDGYVLLFGGESPQGGPPLGDTWAFFDGAWKEICSGSGASPSCANEPTPSIRATMVYDPAASEVIEYDWGLGQTWAFANGSWANLTTAVHPPVQELPSQIGYDGADGTVVALTLSGATWQFADGRWSATAVHGTAPIGRTGAQMYFDPTIDRTVLFGGIAGAEPLTDVWTFAHDAWSPVTPTGFPPQVVASTFDPEYGYEAVLTDGSDGGPVGLWSLVNGTFAPLPIAPGNAPSDALAPAMTFDGKDGYLFLFSGEESTANGPAASTSSWAAVDPLEPIEVNLSRPAVVVGDTVRITSEARGGVLPYTFDYLTLPPGCHGVNSASLLCRTYEVGNYSVRVQVEDGTWGTIALEGNLTIAAVPVATIGVAEQVITAGLPDAFEATIAGGLPPFTDHWNFGDGHTAVGANVTHAFAAEGSYNVTVTALNATGTPTVDSIFVYVNPDPTFTLLNITPVETDANVAVVFSAAAAGGTTPVSYAWSTGDGIGHSTLPVYTYAYPAAGEYRVTVWANDSLGASTEENRTVDVNPDPIVGILAKAAEYNLTVALVAATQGGTAPFHFLWQLGDGFVTTGPSVTHVYPHPGNFTAEVTLSDGAGWVSTTRLVLDLHPARPPSPPPPWYDTTDGWVMLAVPLALGAIALAVVIRYAARRAPRTERPPDAEASPDEDTLPDPEEPSSYALEVPEPLPDGATDDEYARNALESGEEYDP